MHQADCFGHLLLPSAFDHERRVVASGVPNPKWRVGEGLTETAPEGADKEVYELFKQSKTKHGQETLFSRIDPAKKEPGDVCAWSSSRYARHSNHAFR